MKLYLWRDVFADYTSGCAFAIADSKEEAADIAIRDHEYYGRYYGIANHLLSRVVDEKRQELLQADCEVHELTEKFGFSISGGG
jgi:hypothetical protein